MATPQTISAGDFFGDSSVKVVPAQKPSTVAGSDFFGSQAPTSTESPQLDSNPSVAALQQHLGSGGFLSNLLGQIAPVAESIDSDINFLRGKSTTYDQNSPRQEGAQIASQGDSVKSLLSPGFMAGNTNLAQGLSRAVLGTASEGLQAVFSPFTASAQTLFPGKGVGSQIGQAATVGTELGGPVGTGVGAGIGAAMAGIQKLIAPLQTSHPVAYKNINDSLNLVLALAGEKAQSALGTSEGQPAGSGDILNKPALEGVGDIAKNVVNTGKVALTPLTTSLPAIGKFASGLAKFATSNVTGISPESISRVIANPDNFAPSEMAQFTREGIAKEALGAVQERLDNLSETGKEYKGVRQSTAPVNIPEGTIENILQKHGIGVGDDGKLTFSRESTPTSPGDRSALQSWYDTYAQKPGESYTANAFLNARKGLDHLAQFDTTKTDSANVIARDLRSGLNTAVRGQIPGLEDLDTRFSGEVDSLRKVKSDYFNSDGTLKDGAINKIANLGNKGKDAVLSRLEEVSPGITEKIKTLKAVEDIQSASGNQPRAYARGTLIGGALVTGNLPAVVASVLSYPDIAVKILRGYGKVLDISNEKLQPILDSFTKGGQTPTGQNPLAKPIEGQVPPTTPGNPQNEGSAPSEQSQPNQEGGLGQGQEKQGNNPYKSSVSQHGGNVNTPTGGLDRVAQDIKSGGITYDTNAQKPVTSGYAVSIYPDRTQTLSPEDLTAEKLQAYIKKNADVLTQKGHYLGGWYDTDSGKVYLDVSATVPNKADAVSLGQKYNQKSIADLDAISKGNFDNAFIDTGGTGENTGKLPSTQSRANDILKLQSDLPENRPPVKRLGGGGAQMVPIYEGEQDLTTKVLDRLKGRDLVSKQFISDLSNAADLKQPERNLIRKTLDEFSDTVPVKDFASKVKTELLPLETSNLKDGRYESISLPQELRGPVADYTERIYSSPIKTSAGDVHYSGEYPNANYFAHTRIEDLPSNVAQDEIKNFKGTTEFNPEKASEVGNTRRVIELQSDLFQKGRLEGEVGQFGSLKGNESRASIGEEEMARRMGGRSKEVAKLEPYRNTWQERIVREEVKQAAVDGKTKLQFPTGETAMKIEGLGESASWADIGNYVEGDEAIIAGPGDTLSPSELKVGQRVARVDEEVGSFDPHDSWIITDVLGDGKFKAVPKETYDAKRYIGTGDLGGGLTKEKYQQGIESAKETFDISGEQDTSNPIYKFYEKEVGRYLKNNYDAKIITDPQGVKWFQVNVPKSAAKTPVEARRQTTANYA